MALQTGQKEYEKQNLVFNKYEYSGLKLSYILSVMQNDKQ
jgi:hypothetical protein